MWNGKRVRRGVMGRWWGWARGVVLAGALAWGVLGEVPRAQGQFDASSMARAQLVSKRSVDGYAALLGLDKVQTETAMTLLDGFRAASEATIKDFQNKLQEMQNKAQNSGDWQGFQKEMAETGQKMQEKMQGDEKQFFDDLKSICTPEQAVKWERVERMRRREQGLRMSFVSGQGVDLIQISQREGLQGTAEVMDLLLEYESAIDKPLMDLKRMQDEQTKRQQEMMEKMSKDPMAGMEFARKMLGELAEVGRTMRGVNRDYTRKIAAVLPEEKRQAFEEAVDRRSFPRVYKSSYAAEVTRAALGLSDLSDEQKQTLGQIGRDYARDAKGLNEKWARAIEAQEDKHNGVFGVMMDGAMSQFGGAEKDAETKAVGEAWDARKELDDKTAARVKEVLNQDQWAKMPEKKVESQVPWQQMMEMEDGEEAGEEK